MAYVMVKTKHGVVIYVVMTVTVVTVMIANVLIVVAAEVATAKLLLSTNSHMIGTVQVLQEPAQAIGYISYLGGSRFH